MTLRKNINRGYMKLRVWDDAKALYILTCRIFRPMPYDLRRVVTQQIASVDSIHRNIAEGYCRKRPMNPTSQHAGRPLSQCSSIPVPHHSNHGVSHP